MTQTSGEKSEALAIAEWLKHEYPDVADFLVSLDTRVQELEATVNNSLTVETEEVTHKKMYERVEMNNYLLFAGHNYYPSGGWEDFIASFATREEAQSKGVEEVGDAYDWYHVVDLSSGRIIVKGGVRDEL